jgi:hypothetical protein
VFDRNDRPLKREYETLGWLDLPELGRRERMATRRTGPAILIAIGAFFAAIAIAITAAG